MKIGVITIVYDGYGRFIYNWVKSIFKQKERVNEIVIVLSHNHGLLAEHEKAIKYTSAMIDIEVKFIYIGKRKSIGELRNCGIREMKSDWILYFSADDVLLENAVEEIGEARVVRRSGGKIVEEADVVALRYYQECYCERIEQATLIPEKDKMMDWRKHYRNSGYIAFKKSIWEEYPYDDNDFPNFPFLFRLVKNNKRFGRTQNPCAVYIKRKDSHSGKRTEEQDREAYRIIDNAAKMCQQ